MVDAGLLLVALLFQAGAVVSPAPPAAASTPPRFELHASFGFRLRGPAYRLQNGGAAVSAQLCRLPGWAGASVAVVRFEARHADGQIYETHPAYPPRLAIQLGQNCAIAAVRFKAAPVAGDALRICTPGHGEECQ